MAPAKAYGGHILTVNVWPAAAVTPHTGSLRVSPTVPVAVHDEQALETPEGAAVGAAVSNLKADTRSTANTE